MRNFTFETSSDNMKIVSGHASDIESVVERLVRAFSNDATKYPGLTALGEAERVFRGTYATAKISGLNYQVTSDWLARVSSDRFTPSEIKSLFEAAWFLASVDRRGSSAPFAFTYANLNEGYTVLLVNVDHLG